MRSLRIFLATGEHSGDALGAKLMEALRRRVPDVEFAGVGGERMESAGLVSLFPISEIAVMGIAAVVARLRSILARIRETADAAIAYAPDALVIIDSPDFTHRVARRVRAQLCAVPVVDYVSPSVWAWRPGRANAMARYVDHVLALLPFEPEEHRKLGGPACTYVGHPLIERLDELRPSAQERAAMGEGTRRVLVLPGSRAGVVRRHLDIFAEALARVRDLAGPFALALPTTPQLAREISEHAVRWPVRPEIVVGEAEKIRAFRGSHAALAASGTVTLELALSHVPMVAAYRPDPLVRLVRPFFSYRMHSFLLPNLILGDNTIPEFIDGGTKPGADPQALAAALAPLLSDTPQRQAQLEGLQRLDQLMRLGDETPSGRAARIVLETIEARGR